MYCCFSSTGVVICCLRPTLAHSAGLYFGRSWVADVGVVKGLAPDMGVAKGSVPAEWGDLGTGDGCDVAGTVGRDVRSWPSGLVGWDLMVDGIVDVPLVFTVEAKLAVDVRFCLGRLVI